MLLDIRARLEHALSAPTDILLQLESAPTGQQVLGEPQIWTSPVEHFARVPADAGIGERIWIRADGIFSCTYTAKVRITRPDPDFASLSQTPVHLLPGDTVQYLMPSRFCASDEFQSFVGSEFPDEGGGPRIVAIRDWIASHLSYVPGSSTSHTTAGDTFIQRQGICRDYAHVMVALARASAIPARFASVYAPGVTPPDFHAVAEVFLEGAWHLVDATGMATASDIAVIGVGRDAADVAFMTSFGPTEFRFQSVEVTRIDG